MKAGARGKHEHGMWHVEYELCWGLGVGVIRVCGQQCKQSDRVEMRRKQSHSNDDVRVVTVQGNRGEQNGK